MIHSISPGPMKLAALVNDANYKNAPEDAKKQREKELQMYATFPMYPTGKLRNLRSEDSTTEH